MINQKPKRRIKNDIKFLITLNEEQKEAKSVILNNKITVLKGKAGSGKTQLAVYIALNMLFNKEIEKVIITRPLVTAGEETGFLPGNIKEKTDPFTAPIYDNMYRLYNKEKIDKEVIEGRIEMVPFAYMRGRNFSNSLVIVDEAQNITSVQMELLLGRMCLGSKMIICGDTAQIDLKDRNKSGFKFICENFNEIEGFQVVSLLTNHRDPIVEEIIKIYDKTR